MLQLFRIQLKHLMKITTTTLNTNQTKQNTWKKDMEGREIRGVFNHTLTARRKHLSYSNTLFCVQCYVLWGIEI